jgi:hypothetical protein
MDKRDAERAEAERLRDEGNETSIGWGGGGKTIDHEAGPEPSNILRRLREFRPTADGLRWTACDQDAVPPFRRTDAASFHLVFIWRLLRAPLA